MIPPQIQSGRLDSWKVIATYLGRDVRTIRRWEREFALPIRRVAGGRGRSVFAYVAEIDEWLRHAPPHDGVVEPIAAAVAAPPAAPAAAPAASATRQYRLSLRGGAWFALAAAIVLLAGTAWRAREKRVNVSDLRVAVAPDGIVASQPDGAVRWRYNFPPDYAWSLPYLDMAAPVVTRDPAAVYMATVVGQHRPDGRLISGVLTSLGVDGSLQHTFSFEDTVAFRTGTYGPPWAITSYAVSTLPDGKRLIAIAAHHYVWGASLVTVLDEHWRRRGTFVHFGWIEAVRWLAPNRLVVSGFSNSHDGGMVALLDPSGSSGVRGQGPEATGSAGYCETCGPAAPLREVIMPRSALNRETASPFNRAVLEIVDGRVLARTLEVESGGPGVVDAIYEFSPSLDLLRASYSDSYRDMRRSLTARGLVREGAARGGNDERPQSIQVWDAARGWRTVGVGAP